MTLSCFHSWPSHCLIGSKGLTTNWCTLDIERVGSQACSFGWSLISDDMGRTGSLLLLLHSEFMEKKAFSKLLTSVAAPSFIFRKQDSRLDIFITLRKKYFPYGSDRQTGGGLERTEPESAESFLSFPISHLHTLLSPFSDPVHFPADSSEEITNEIKIKCK